MNNNKNKSIVMIVVVLSSIFILSSALGKPVSAQTGSSKADNTISNYKDFISCLLNAESTKGYATKKEIQTCFSPIYINSTSGAGTGTDTGTSAPSVGQ